MKLRPFMPILLVIWGISPIQNKLTAQLDLDRVNKNTQEKSTVHEKKEKTVASKNIPLDLGISLFIGVGIAFGLKKIIDSKRKGTISS